MSLKHFLPALAIALIALAFTAVLWSSARTAGAQVGPIYTMGNASSTNVLTTSKRVAATSTGLRFREIVNLSATSVYCNYNDVTATFTAGFIVNGSSTKQWYGETLYTGAIRCIAPATSAITVNEAL
jgi:hypothetical protein